MPAFTFTSPDGKSYTVNGPDGATQEQAFAMLQQQLKAPAAPPAGPSVGGALDAASTGVVNAAAGMGNAAIDIGSRALGFGPNKPIPYQSQTPAGQATLDSAGRALQSIEGTPDADTQQRQQMIDARRKQLDGTFAGDVTRNAQEVLPEAAQLLPLAPLAGKVANGVASAQEIAAARPIWARAGFSSEQSAAAHELGLRNGLDNPVAGYLSGSVKRELLTNGNADVGNTIARYAARVPEEVSPGVTQPLTYEALDKALAPMEAVYQRAAAGIPNGDAVLLKLRQLRRDGFKAINSDDPDVITKGRDMLGQADGLESFIEKNISPTSGTSLAQLRAARQAIAQNRAVYEALQGEDINMASLGRMYRAAPNKFADGPLKTLAQFAENNGAVVGRRIKGADTTLRQGVEGASGALDITKPGSWPQVARVTGLPQSAVRGPGVAQTLKTLAPRDPNEFAPLQ